MSGKDIELKYSPIHVGKRSKSKGMLRPRLRKKLSWNCPYVKFVEDVTLKVSSGDVREKSLTKLFAHDTSVNDVELKVRLEMSAKEVKLTSPHAHM